MALDRERNDMKSDLRRTAEREIGEGMQTRSVKDVFLILIVAVSFSLVFNSQGLAEWTSRLPVNPVCNGIVEAASKWNEMMEHIGATRLFELLQQGFRSIQNS